MSNSLYTKFVSGYLFPLHEQLKSHRSVAIRQSLEQSQWLTTDEILTEQSQRLHRFITEVYHNVPYYQTMFDSLNLKPEDIKTVADLSKLPFITKPLISENFDQIISTKAGKMIKGCTAGSSGTPLSFLLGMERVSHDVAQKWRATRWWGVDIGDKEQVVWGSPIEVGAQDRVRQIRDLMFRTQLLPAFDLTPEKIQQFLEQIQSYRPKMLFGYPSVYEVLAKYAVTHGIVLDNLGIKAVFVTSELLYPQQRQLIEKVFGCQVANGYGGRDSGFIAHQCPEGGMHISAEDIVVEIVDPDGNAVANGNSGQVVVTHLGAGDFPLIRYRTGDVAKISCSSCPCGRGLPMLEDIHGRTTDFVLALDGRLMHGAALTYAMRELEDIVNYKIIQHSKELTQVLLVTKSGELSLAIVDEIRTQFQQRLGQDVAIEIELREEIPAEKSGKYRFLVSHAVTDSVI